jgi:MFS family permease
VSTTPLRRNRDFMLLQAGQLFSTFGSRVSAIAYPLLVLAVTGSAAKAGLAGAAQFTPLLLFNLPAGVAADRFDRRRLMIMADVVSAASVGTLAALVLTHHASFWTILVVAFVDATGGVFFRAGQSGAFRAVVPLAQLPAAASVSQARGATVLLSAPPVGGALFGLGRGLPFLVDALSYVFSTVSVLLMRTRFQEERVRDTEPLRQQLAEGLSFLSHVPFLRTSMLMIAASNFSTTGVQLAVIVLAKRQGLSSASIGAFVALVGATALLGSVASPLLRRFFSLHTILLSEFWASRLRAVLHLAERLRARGRVRRAGLLLPEHRLRRYGVLVCVDARPARRARDVGLEHATRARRPVRSARGRIAAQLRVAARHDRRLHRLDARGSRRRHVQLLDPVGAAARGPRYSCSFSRRSRLTTFGSALPPVSFITWPTRKPSTPSLPPR